MYNLRLSPYNSNVSFKGKKQDNVVTLNTEISKTLKTLHDRAEREVTPYDYFKPVQIPLENPDKSLYVGDITLRISQPPKESSSGYKTQRNLEVVVCSPNGKDDFSKIIANGNKKELLESLKDKALAKELEDFIHEASGMLIEDSY